MALTDIGEDTIVYANNSDFAANLEVYNLPIGAKSPDGNGTIMHAKGIEVGHIFKLGTVYSEAMKAQFTDETGVRQDLIMGCYGIGVSRVLMAVIEQNHDEFGIMMPKTIAPFDIHIIVIDPKADNQVKFASELENTLIKAQYEVLIDDRIERPGVKFSEADLIGLPIRITIGKNIEKGVIEVKFRNELVKHEVEIAKLINFIKEYY
jgi:prolyl-tRNA synthetase